MKTQQEIEKEFDEKLGGYFAIANLRCKKCGHLKGSHYWNGGGRWEYKGYDHAFREIIFYLKSLYYEI